MKRRTVALLLSLVLAVCCLSGCTSTRVRSYTEAVSSAASDVYKSQALVRSEAEADDLMDEVIDRFGDPPPSVYTLVQVALLRSDAGKVGVTDISQKNGCLKFLLAQFDMQKVSLLYARPEFKGRLKVDAGAKPGVILRLKTRTHVIEQARAFVSAWADAQGDRA